MLLLASARHPSVSIYLSRCQGNVRCSVHLSRYVGITYKDVSLSPDSRVVVVLSSGRFGGSRLGVTFLYAHLTGNFVCWRQRTRNGSWLCAGKQRKNGERGVVKRKSLGGAVMPRRASRGLFFHRCLFSRTDNDDTRIGN